MTDIAYLSDAELIWARGHWQHWGGATNKYPTEQEWEDEFTARAAARAYDRELELWFERGIFPSRWLPPDWPHERAANGSRLPFG